MTKIRPYSTIFIATILFVGLVIYRYGLSVYNADQVVFASMLVDMRSGFSLADWEWPANTHFFPELSFYLILNFILRFLNPTFIHQLFPLFATFLFFLAVYWISWEIFDFEIDNKKIWLSSIVLLISLLMAFANKWTYFLAFIFQPALHGVAYTGTLLCLLLVFKIQSTLDKQHKENKSLNRHEIILSVSVFLMALSESFFVIWFVMPICATLFLLKRRKNISKFLYLRLEKIIIIAAILGYGIHQLILPNTSTGHGISFKHIIESLGNFAIVLAENPDYAGYAILSFFLSGFCYFWVSKQLRQNTELSQFEANSKVFWTWNFCSIIASFLMTFVFGMFENRGSIRYLQPLNFATVLTIVWILIRCIELISEDNRQIALKSIKLVTIAFGVFALILLPSYFNSHTVGSEYRLYQCLKADDVGVLYSGFWKSKPTYLFSEGSIIPRQVSGSGDRYHHSNNDNWYTFKPARDYKVAVLDDTKFGKQNFRDGKMRSCDNFNYQLLPKDREDYLIDLVK